MTAPRRRPPVANAAATDLFDALAQAAQRPCGIDEVGRGPLAGPVVAAAVILDPARPLAGLRDSKQIKDLKRREEIARTIRAGALAWAVGEASVEEIDRLNILRATLLAMQRAVAALAPAADYALVDGNQLPALAIPARAIVGGDASVPAISAASIIAKTHRDALMAAYDREYPGYGFARHVGYGSALHLQRLRALGPCPLHRKTFGTVRLLLAGADGGGRS